MSLRSTAYVKRKVTVFPTKSVFLSKKKSAIKFLCVKTFSSKCVMHSLAYLTRAQMVGGVRLLLSELV